MKDGKVFDFISRTTPTSGADLNVITYLFRTISKALTTKLLSHGS